MLIIGAKGFAKEIAEVICQNSSEEKLVFFDDINVFEESVLFDKYRILHNDISAVKYFQQEDRRFVLGIGNPILRYQLAQRFIKLGGELTSITSPSAIIGRFENNIDDGVNIMANVVIEAGNSIGEGCLIHNAAFISHDVKIGNYCEISPSANVLGGVQIGNFSSIGAAAVILPKIVIGDNVIVGAGAVVTHNISDNTTVIGVPAKPIVK